MLSLIHIWEEDVIIGVSFPRYSTKEAMSLRAFSVYWEI